MSGREYAAPPCPPIRVQLRRTKGWRMPPNTVKVCRPTRWGNPFKAGPWKCGHPDCPNGGTHPGISPRECVERYRSWIAGMLMVDPKFLDPLRAKNLACWCRLGDPCHADVLLELANAKGGGG